LKKDTVFFRQAELLLRVLPFVNEEEVFALKGGTAINFFLAEWRQGNTRRHYENSVTTSAYSRAFDTPWSTPLQVKGNYRTS